LQSWLRGRWRAARLTGAHFFGGHGQPENVLQGACGNVSPPQSDQRAVVTDWRATRPRRDDPRAPQVRGRSLRAVSCGPGLKESRKDLKTHHRTAKYKITLANPTGNVVVVSATHPARATALGRGEDEERRGEDREREDGVREDVGRGGDCSGGQREDGHAAVVGGAAG